jgi:transposase-like protein
MTHRIREAMRREPIAGLLSGRVVADETWYGGKPSNRKGHDSRGKPKGQHDRTPIMSLVSRETGEARSMVIPNVRGETLGAVLRSHTKPSETHLQTDQLPAYRKVGRQFAQHSTVDHEGHEYVHDGATTNHAEGYFAQLKRSLDGTHHAVSVEHLDRYSAEFDFRFSTCKSSDTERVGMLIDRVGGRRLTYRQPAGL